MKSKIKEIKAVLYFSKEGDVKGHLTDHNLKNCHELIEENTIRVYKIDIKNDSSWLNKELALRYVQKRLEMRPQPNHVLYLNKEKENIEWIFKSSTEWVILNNRSFVMYDDNSYAIIEGDVIIGSVSGSDGSTFKSSIMTLRD